MSTQALDAREQARQKDGKFGVQTHDRASSIDLYDTDWMGDDANDTLQKARDAARQKRLAALPDIASIRRSEAPTGEELLLSREMLARVTNIARSTQGRTLADGSYDADDTASQTIMELQRMHREGKLKDPEKIPNSLIAKIVTGARVRSSDLSSRHITALSNYRSAVREEEVSLGRELSRSEQDEVAENVRQQIPSKNRPGAGYHRPATRQSLDEEWDDGTGSRLEHALADTSDPYTGIHDTSADDSAAEVADQFESAIEAATQAGLINRQDLQRRPWTALATLYEASGNASSGPLPQVSPQTNHPTKIINATADLKERGGAVKAARDYVDGVTADDSSLFAPFPEDIDDDQRMAVAEFVVHLSERAGEDRANQIHRTAMTTSRTDSGPTTERVHRALGIWEEN